MDLPHLNLPVFEPVLRIIGGKHQILDPIRKIYAALTPEEWVRQNFIHYLVNDRLIPPGLIAVEKHIRVNRLSRRCDLVVYTKTGKPAMVIECKAPGIKISQETLNQAIRYNLTLNIRYLVLTNGLNHFCFAMDYTSQACLKMDHIPDHQELETTIKI